MAEFSNPQLPEDVNVSRTNPLLDFARLLAAVLVIAAVALGALMLAADHLAKFIPFGVEAKLARQFESSLPARGAVTDYLQSLADRLAQAQVLPAEMSIRVHFVDEDVVNAFATLGGHIIVYRGLLARLPSENAIAMVLSHEIAHVKLRHPIASLGRGVAFGVAIAAVSAATGGDIAGRVLGSAGLLSALSFSREQERRADAEALGALVGVYGHAGASQHVFHVLEKELEQLPAQPPAILRTHPLDAQRVEALRKLARRNGWPLSGDLQPLPDPVREALSHNERK